MKILKEVTLTNSQKILVEILNRISGQHFLLIEECKPFLTVLELYSTPTPNKNCWTAGIEEKLAFENAVSLAKNSRHHELILVYEKLLSEFARGSFEPLAELPIEHYIVERFFKNVPIIRVKDFFETLSIQASAYIKENYHFTPSSINLISEGHESHYDIWQFMNDLQTGKVSTDIGHKEALHVALQFKAVYGTLIAVREINHGSNSLRRVVKKV